jgi:hypothetical protein
MSKQGQITLDIQITWKTIYLSVKAYSAGQTVPSTAQIRAEGNRWWL